MSSCPSTTSTYSQVAVLTAPLRQGFLTASLPAAAGWDSVDTLSVDLSESGGALSGTSEASAQQGATISLVDSELLAYEFAALTSGNAYNLTGLARALGGTAGAPHSTGAPFARLDGAIVKYNLPDNLIGQTLYFKFQSFNVFGGGLEDLSTCAVYAFTPSGRRSLTRSSRSSRPAFRSISARSIPRRRFWTISAPWPPGSPAGSTSAASRSSSRTRSPCSS